MILRSILGTRLHWVEKARAPKAWEENMCWECGFALPTFPITKVAICQKHAAWKLCMLHPVNVTHSLYHQHHCLLQTGVPLKLSQPKICFTQLPSAYEGQSFHKLTCTWKLPSSPLFWIVFVSQQLKIPPWSSEPKIWPKQHHHLRSQTNKITLYNYSEPAWKEDCGKSTESLVLRISHCSTTLPNSCCILLEQARSPQKSHKGFQSLWQSEVP